MLRPSKKLLFAIEAVLDVAYHGGTRPVRSSEISERQGIPKRYLEPVLQQLVHDGILNGQRGPKGGYNLARERRRITLGEIARVVQGLEGAEDPEEEGSPLARKVVRPTLDEAFGAAMRELETRTIQDLCDQAREQGIASAAASVPDFTI